MDNKLKVLYLEDSPRDIEILSELLISSGFELEMDCTQSEKEFVNMLRNNKYDVILADFKLPGFDGFVALKWALEICPDIPVIIVSGTLGEEKAIELIKLGASDFILKDRMARLPNAIQDEIEHKLVKKALRESDELISLLMKHSPVYIYIKELSPAGSRVIVSSDNFIEMTGIPASEMKGKTMEELFPAEFAATINEDDRTVMTSGKVLQLEENFNNRNYTTIKFPLNRNGKTLIAGYTIDITEENKVKVALKSSEMRYHDLFNKANEGLLILTFEGQLSEINLSFADMHGYTVDELINHNIRDLDVLGERTMDDRSEIILRVHAGEVVRFEVEHYHKDGHIFPLSVTLSLVSIDGQEFYIAFHQDITERKAAEKEILKKIDEMVRFQRLTVGRELTMIELKKEINEFLRQSGQEEKYVIVG
jgi:PAS domain S-box-containing protein